MHWDLHDTIVALASAPGGAARGIVRLSGIDSARIASSCFRSAKGQPSLGGSTHAQCIDGAFHAEPFGETHPLIIPASALVWPNEKSFTRQPIVEIHALASPPLLQAIVDQLARQGARPAERGEFTLRAFLAGRIDLTQAEAVLGVVDARSSAELNASLAQLAGGLSTPLTQLRQHLLQVLAELEAGLDFVEEDIEFIGRGQLQESLATAKSTIAAALEQLATRGDASQRSSVVLIGDANAGKSSLFNRLIESLRLAGDSKTPAALESPVAGTTRDYVSASVVLGERLVQLVDTAGWMSASPSSIETSAQQAALEQSRQATVLVHCVDASATRAAACPHPGEAISPTLTVLTKADLLECERRARVVAERSRTGESLSAPPDRRPPVDSRPLLVSNKTGEGIPALVQQVARLLEELSVEAVECVAATAVRCADSLRRAAGAIDRAEALLDADAGDELIAAEVRCALTELGEVVGAVYNDDVLDRIFSQFCIGK